MRLLVGSVAKCMMASIIIMSPQKIKSYVILSFLTADFTNLPITIEIPAAANDRTQEFVLPNFFQVIDDDIDENEQSFAIVAELGPDVTDTPFNFSCFQLQAGETECFGRRGATEIRITDNDRKLIELQFLYHVV